MTERTVLLGEDDPKLREIYATWVREPYSVDAFGNGDALVDALDEDTAAVVTDWRLGGLQQRDLLAALVDSHYDPALVVISGIEPRVALQDLGADAFLEKPFDSDDLLETLHAVLQPQSAVMEMPSGLSNTRGVNAGEPRSE